MEYQIRKEINRPTLTVRIMGKIFLSILIIYYFWYNELYGHNSLIVYGSFLGACFCLFADLLKNRVISTSDFYPGIWSSFLIVIYSFTIGLLVAYNRNSLLISARIVGQYTIIGFCIFYFSMHEGNGLDWLLNTINLGALICCCYLIMRPVEILRGRFAISYTNIPNTLGFILVMGMFSIVYRFRAKAKWIIINIPQLFYMFYGIILTGSRKSLISAMILMSLCFIEIIRIVATIQSNWKYGIVVLAIIIGIIIGRYLVEVYAHSQIAMRMETVFSDEARMNHYHRAWRIFLEKPIFGGGLDQYKHWAGIGAYAHSTYAEAIADFGIIGCLIYFYPIIRSGFDLIRNANINENTYRIRIVFALWIVELFMGSAQIFFFDIVHFIAWTIIYLKCRYPSNI